MSENIVFSWDPDFYLKWTDFKAESNPAIFEDSHSVIKYRFTWILNSDIINDKIMFLIEDVHLIVEFNPFCLGLGILNQMRIYSNMNREILI